MRTRTSYVQSAWVTRDVGYRASGGAGPSRVLLLATAAYLYFGLSLFAQTSDSQTAEELNKSWMATTDLKSDNLNPTRIIESHRETGNQTLDKQSLENRGFDGHVEPYLDVEKETLKVDATTVRTTTRTFGHANGVKTLVQVTEEERHALSNNDLNVVRITSNPDVNGKLRAVQREIVETKQIDKDVEETKTTVMLSSVDGGLAPAFKTSEVRKRGANDAVEAEKTTWLPDANGKLATERGTAKYYDARIKRP